MDAGIDYDRFEAGRHVNYYTLDRTLQRELRRVYGDEAYRWAEPQLSAFGAAIGDTVADNADLIDDRGPELETYDRFGEVQNFVRYPAEQFENERIVYESGIVADVFEAPPGRDEPMPFVHYLGMLTLLAYAESGGLACPVAMTAGAALVLEKFDDGTLEGYYDGLVSREYEGLVEGAMFLTEKQGGSDVGATETLAAFDESDGWWRLTGEKWFCSNIDAEATLALARTADAPDGTAGLSMFLVPHGDPELGILTKRERIEYGGVVPPDALNQQRYRRLKDKLGTISVPTGEVEFEGARAVLVGDADNGFKQMAEMLNLERLSNAAGACGVMGRALLESKIHAANREAFGRTIDAFPLMREDLVDMSVDYEAAVAFTFEAGRLFAEREQALRAGEEAEAAYRLMRLLVPIAKLRTARMAVETASYTMEIHGGNGYVNEFVTHRLLRDAQVLPIWEGTENVLSLDVLRAIDREDAHEPFMDAMRSRLDDISHPGLARPAGTAESAYHDLLSAFASLEEQDRSYAQLSAKRLSHFVFEVFTAGLLLEQAQRGLEDGEGRTALIAQRFIERELAESAARGIPSGDRFALEYFDPIVRYEPIPPSSLPAVADSGE